VITNDTHTSLLDSTQELRVIRSHRAPRRKLPRRLVLTVAAVLAAGTLMPLGASAVVPPTSVAAVSAVQAAPVAMAERGSTVSRSMLARKAAKATRTQRINKVINYAMAQRGDRYRFGAAGPNTWDCSGLVKMSYRKIGVKLPHFTGAMLRHGKHISRKHLKRGDLVFPTGHHVGIYIGGNKMIVASSGHHKVMVQHVYSFYAGRRII
jgi:cell wall-associated NlpC family hydrolase